MKIWEIKIEQTHWEDHLEPFPFSSINGNWHPGEFSKMFRIFLSANQVLIDNVVNNIMDKIMSQNSDVFPKGRQTWDPIHERSVHSSVAYGRFLNLFKINLNVVCSNNLEWIQCFFKCLNLEELKTKEIITENSRKRRYSVRDKQYLEVDGQISTVKDKIIKGKEDIFKYMIDLSRSFCSYIKHGERGKMDRRAIASANPILRMFLHIMESFHLELGKHLPGLTISIGNDEKRRKMIAEMSGGSMGIPTEISLQATQDATKWNEFLNPSTFAMMHESLFSNKNRDELSDYQGHQNKGNYFKL